MKKKEIDLGDGAIAREEDSYVEIITLTGSVVLTINQARRLAVAFIDKVRRN